MSSQVQSLIDYFGGQKETAKAISITQPTLSHSLKLGELSTEAALRAQKATGNKFSALDLRPSLKEHFKEINVA
ncbi:hypothetical protein [Acinetobacter sp. YH12086]|uniref:hypothetical protein n=1 Tax=Acinetobacter sp. YH12086 TaxID=2601078 RepID=UPI0015D3A542|nr:hypothetical protein [Acinetobacter sp. YH12086]